MKTVKEWFESVENPILKKVLLMRLTQNQNYKVFHLNAALEKGFNIYFTPEKHEFWFAVIWELKNHNNSPTFNTKYPVMQVEWLDKNEWIPITNRKELDVVKSLVPNPKLLDKYFSMGYSGSIYYEPKRKLSSTFESVKEGSTIYPASLFIKQEPKMETLTKLPTYFTIKRDENNPLWDKYIQWLSLTYKVDWTKYNYEGYYGYDGNQHSSDGTDCWLRMSQFQNNPTLITLEQWDNIVNKPKFEVSKWYKHSHSGVTRYFKYLNGTGVLYGNYIHLESSGVFNYTEIEPFGLETYLVKQGKELKDLSEIQPYLPDTHPDKVFVLPKNWCVKVTDENRTVLSKYFDKLYQVKNNYIPGWYFVNNGLCNTFAFTEIPTGYIEISFKQFKSYVLNRKEMKTQTLTLGQIKDLYNADTCTEWKRRFGLYIFNYKFVKDTQPVEIKQKDIDYAVKHCSEEQLQLLKKAGLLFEDEKCLYKVGDWVKFDGHRDYTFVAQIVGMYQENGFLRLSLSSNSKSIIEASYTQYKRVICLATPEEIAKAKYEAIEWDKLKTGSKVLLKNVAYIFDTKQPVTIVFWDSKFEISTIEDGVQFKENENPLSNVASFYQNGVFKSVSQICIKDLITEVISY